MKSIDIWGANDLIHQENELNKKSDIQIITYFA